MRVPKQFFFQVKAVPGQAVDDNYFSFKATEEAKDEQSASRSN